MRRTFVRQNAATQLNQMQRQLSLTLRSCGPDGPDAGENVTFRSEGKIFFINLKGVSILLFVSAIVCFDENLSRSPN